MFHGLMAIVVAFMWALFFIILAVMAGTAGFTPA